MGWSGDIGWGVVYDPRGICPMGVGAGFRAMPAGALFEAAARFGAGRLARALAATFLGLAARRTLRLVLAAERLRVAFTRFRDALRVPVLRRARFLAMR